MIKLTADAFNTAEKINFIQTAEYVESEITEDNINHQVYKCTSDNIIFNSYVIFNDDDQTDLAYIFVPVSEEMITNIKSKFLNNKVQIDCKDYFRFIIVDDNQKYWINKYGQIVNEPININEENI